MGPLGVPYGRWEAVVESHVGVFMRSWPPLKSLKNNFVFLAFSAIGRGRGDTGGLSGVSEWSWVGPERPWGVLRRIPGGRHLAINRFVVYTMELIIFRGAPCGL